MNVSGIITGIVLMILGITLLAVAGINFFETGLFVTLLIYGTLVVGVGLYILFHLNKEDEIEKINYDGGKK
ncbi:MAG: hypothetical protein ABIF88_01085 [archaeon]